METSESLTVGVKTTTITPKAVLHQKFGKNISYKVEEVKISNENGCPGLAFEQKGPCLFRCILQLPEFTIVSESFKKKKDAEQAAAKMALEKLGLQSGTPNPVIQDPWDELTSRISYLFSDEFLSSLHPLTGHFRATMHKKNGLIPISVLTACDGKISTLCKSIDADAESNLYASISIVARVVSRLSGTISMSDTQLRMWRNTPYSLEILESVDNQLSSGISESILVEAVYIPCSLNESVSQTNLNVSSCGYYLDAIAQNLGVTDASNLLISRTIGKASSEIRFYFVTPDSCLSDNGREVAQGTLNVRARYICGQNIYGDAILASIGYRWNSKDLFYEDFPLRSYFRMLLNKTPSGIYKVSRDAILTAELPTVFTTKLNWRGSFPRDILCTFCRQHRLSEPVFSIETIPLKPPSEFSKSLEESDTKADRVNGETNGESAGLGDTFKCDIKIYKGGEMIIHCAPKHIYKKQIDAVHSASLNVLLWLNSYFQELNMPLENLTSSANDLDIQFHPQKFVKEFDLCLSTHGVNEPKNGFRSVKIEGPDCEGASPSNGSIVCLSYAVSLVKEGEAMKKLIESCFEFEFEIGTGAVIHQFETVVTQMCVNQTAFFNMDLPRQDMLLAANGANAKTLPSLSSKTCFLEYSIILLQVTEPMEDRMEQAFFSPPLSKQRVEFALQHIKDSCATTLIDFGCGSGSLLDSLLDYPTSLEHIVGVDLSQKGLSRAAKILHAKLSRNVDTAVPHTCIKSAVLYLGSVTTFDSRVCGFDIGTCLEVIEHMEEDQACEFGDMALGHFRPKILVVSTPNYEYNIILQKPDSANQEDDMNEKSQSQGCKFRNHDHKFEWTRSQFNHWATNLAARHNYMVEFSGVGGVLGVEPGFASQIAVFKRKVQHGLENMEPCETYQAIWEWN